MVNPSSPRRANRLPLYAALTAIASVLAVGPGCGGRAVPPHGIEFTAVIETNSLAAGISPSALLAGAADNLCKRIDKLDLAGVSIRPTNGDRLLIRLPGLTEAAKTNAVRLIQLAGWLEFRLVHEENDGLIKEGITPPSYELLQFKARQRDGTVKFEKVLVRKKASLAGSCIKGAAVVRDTLGNPEIDFTLTPDGTGAFGDVTRENVGRRLAVVLDGEVFSAPVIQSPIETGHGQITGSFDIKEAFELANVLGNPLPVRLRIVNEASF